MQALSLWSFRVEENAGDICLGLPKGITSAERNDVQMPRDNMDGVGRLVVLHLDIAVFLALVGLAGDNVLSVAVKLETGDDDVGGVDVERNSGAVGLFAVYTLNVNDPLLAVDLKNLALGSLR